MLTQEKLNLNAALAFVTGAALAAQEAVDMFRAQKETGPMLGYRVYLDHIYEAKALMARAAEDGSEITYARLIRHFWTLTNDISMSTALFGERVMTILEAGR